MPLFKCIGPIDGDCKTSHATAQEAADHIVARHSQNGWTDREVFDADTGDWYEMFCNFGNGPIVPKIKVSIPELYAKVAEVEKTTEELKADGVKSEEAIPKNQQEPR